MRRPDLPVDGPGDVDVDWSRLPEDWMTRNHRLRSSAGLTGPEWANLIRAQVAEGIIDSRELRFADYVQAL